MATNPLGNFFDDLLEGATKQITSGIGAGIDKGISGTISRSIGNVFNPPPSKSDLIEELPPSEIAQKQSALFDKLTGVFDQGFKAPQISTTLDTTPAQAAATTREGLTNEFDLARERRRQFNDQLLASTGTTRGGQAADIRTQGQNDIEQLMSSEIVKNAVGQAQFNTGQQTQRGIANMGSINQRADLLPLITAASMKPEERQILDFSNALGVGNLSSLLGASRGVSPSAKTIGAGTSPTIGKAVAGGLSVAGKALYDSLFGSSAAGTAMGAGVPITASAMQANAATLAQLQASGATGAGGSGAFVPAAGGAAAAAAAAASGTGVVTPAAAQALASSFGSGSLGAGLTGLEAIEAAKMAQLAQSFGSGAVGASGMTTAGIEAAQAAQMSQLAQSFGSGTVSGLGAAPATAPVVPAVAPGASGLLIPLILPALMAMSGKSGLFSPAPSVSREESGAANIRRSAENIGVILSDESKLGIQQVRPGVPGDFQALDKQVKAQTDHIINTMSDREVETLIQRIGESGPEGEAATLDPSTNPELHKVLNLRSQRIETDKVQAAQTEMKRLKDDANAAIIRAEQANSPEARAQATQEEAVANASFDRSGRVEVERNLVNETLQMMQEAGLPGGPDSNAFANVFNSLKQGDERAPSIIASELEDFFNAQGDE